MNHTHEVHNIRAHLLNYTSFLQDFRDSVQYIIDNPSPWTGNWATDAMNVECTLLLSEIARLQKGMDIPNKRLKNLINTASTQQRTFCTYELTSWCFCVGIQHG